MEVFGNLGEKLQLVDNLLSSYEQENYPSTSWEKICIEIESQIDRKYYVDLRQNFLAKKLMFLKGRGYETYKTKEPKKERKDDSEENAAEDTVDEEMEEDSPVPLVTHVSKNLHSIFYKVEVYINNQQTYSSNGLYVHKSYIFNNFKGTISVYKEFCTAKVVTMKNVPMRLWTLPCPNTFSQRECKKRSVDPMASCYMVNFGLTFSPFLKRSLQILNLGYD